MSVDYKDLEVYRKAMRLGCDVYTEVSNWPPFDRWTLGKQLVSAADSIAANIAEAYGRRSPRERRQFLYIARGSARETECHLTKAIERGLIHDSDPNATNDEIVAVTKMLSRLIRSIRIPH